jgi:hypothetical protein
MLGDDSGVFFNPNDFGVEATITTSLETKTVNGVLDQSGNTQFSGFVANASHQITVFTRDLPSGCAQDDSVEISDKQYTIIKIEPGEPGMSVLALEPQP